MSKLKDVIGSKILALVPIYGNQHQLVKSLIFHFDTYAMICVGVPIVYSNDPREKAEEFRDLLNNYQLEMREKKKN